MGDTGEASEEVVKEPECGNVFEGPPGGVCPLPPKHKGVCTPFHERCSYRRSNGDRCRKSERHGNTEGATKHLFLKKKLLCVCPVCDMLRFFDYAQRAAALSVGGNEDENGPRMVLIHDIHSTVGVRHPLGIAERLYEAIEALHSDDDEAAVNLLYAMVNDEKFQCAQGREMELMAEECKVAKRVHEDRSLIPTTP